MTAPLRLLLVLLIAAGAAGCGTDTTDAPPTDATADASAPITLRGVVVETLYDGAALRVDHEAVPSLGMAAMTMAFPLDAPSLADGLSPGDKVTLSIEAAPRLRVTAIEALPADTQLALASDSSETAASPDSSAAR